MKAPSKNPAAPTVDLERLAAKLAPRVAELVLARLALALGGASAAPYSTRRGHGPEGLSHKRWLAVAPSIPGAVRLPGARWWQVSRECYARWVEQGCPSATRAAANDSTWSPAAEYARTGGRGR
jgi:hypothetical protein